MDKSDALQSRPKESQRRLAAKFHKKHPAMSASGRPARNRPRAPDWDQGLHLEALANLAHELRSPVQALLGYLDILRDELGDEQANCHKRILERLNVNAHDLAQTVENVMEFSVAKARGETVGEEYILLHDLIGEIAPALEAANQSKSLTINFSLNDAPRVFRSRRRPIKSILLNLALNAIKFTERGSITIAFRSALSALGAPAIQLEVSDTGPGIEAAMLLRAFKQCEQLSNSSARKYRGVGLGLAVVQRNVTALGAKILVDTKSNRGSIFTVTVPLGRSIATQPDALSA
jgi:signal transduction histidine kinase